MKINFLYEPYRLLFRILYLIPLIGFINFSLFAQEDTDENVRLGGFVELDQITYFKNVDGKVNSRNQGIVQLEIENTLNDKFKFFGAVEIRNDLSDPDRNRVFVDEVYVDMFSGNFDLRFGKQLITWGEADGLNPTNNLNPIDFSDLLDIEDERIGIFALQLKYYLSGLKIEGVLSPIFNPSILPTPDSRWFSKYPSVVQLETGKVIPASFELLDTQLPERDLRSLQYGLKAAGMIGGWDFSASYYHGFDDLPMFRQIPILLSADSASFLIQPKIQALSVLGFDFSTTLGKYGLRGELGYFMTSDRKGNDPFVDDPFVQFVVGIDKSFSDVIGDNNIFMIVQWVQQMITTGAEVPNTRLNNVFQRSLLTRMEYDINNFAKFSLQATYDFKAKNYYIQPELTYSLSSGLNLSLLSDILGGPDDTFFGQYKNNKRIQLKLKYDF